MTSQFSLETDDSQDDETILMNTQIPWCREVFYGHYSTLCRFRQAVILQGKVLRRRIGKDVLQQLDPHPREAFRAAIAEEGARAEDMQWFLDDLSYETLHGDRLLTEEGLVFLGNLLWAFSWRGLPEPEAVPHCYKHATHASRKTAGEVHAAPVRLVVNVGAKGGAGAVSAADVASSTGALSAWLSAELPDCKGEDAKKKRRHKSSHVGSTMHTPRSAPYTPRSTPSKDGATTHTGHRPWHY